MSEKYKPSRDLPLFAKELGTVEPTKLAEYISKKLGINVIPESIEMWFKEHSRIYEELKQLIPTPELEIVKDLIAQCEWDNLFSSGFNLGAFIQKAELRGLIGKDYWNDEMLSTVFARYRQYVVAQGISEDKADLLIQDMAKRLNLDLNHLRRLLYGIGKPKYKPSRDIPLAVTELKTFLPTAIVDWVLKKRNEKIADSDVVTWLKQNPKVTEQLKKIIERPTEEEAEAEEE